MVVIQTYIGLLMPAPKGAVVGNAHFAKVETAPIATLQNPEAALDLQPASGPSEIPATQVHLNYDFNAVLKGGGPIPRLILATLPPVLLKERESQKRKAIFLKTVLPLILQVNEQIIEDRVRLEWIQVQQNKQDRLPALDRLWLAVMAERYGTQRGDIEAILNRHDVVPPSLALAQAATESAWGSSRFVREGNAIFGQWTFSAQHNGIVPAQRLVGKSHRVRAFATLSESVDSYVANLNKHRAYTEFRTLRAAMRRQGQTLDGMQLAGTLFRYSERGMAYVADLRAIIFSNGLGLVDEAKLSVNNNRDPLI